MRMNKDVDARERSPMVVGESKRHSNSEQRVIPKRTFNIKVKNLPEDMMRKISPRDTLPPKSKNSS